MARGFLEERAREVRRRVDGELDVVRVGALDAGFVELAAVVSDDVERRNRYVLYPIKPCSLYCPESVNCLSLSW